MLWLIGELNLSKQAAVTSRSLSAGCLQSRIEIHKEITRVNYNGHLSAKAQQSLYFSEVELYPFIDSVLNVAVFKDKVPGCNRLTAIENTKALT